MFARLTDEQEAIRDAVREFAQNEISPHADQWDEEHTFPREIFRPMAEMGLAGLLAPEKYGGSQLPRLTGALIYEELGKADMGTAVWLSVHNMVTGIISRFGDDEQRARWIPRLTSGDLLGAFSLSEAHAGSDVANIQCAARREGEAYILNGSKFWVTNAGVADLYVVFARSGSAGSRGVSAFVVEL
ncbi:MAG TPA: acyl-CoA dehydrogenase family protein, partial [Ktedonobacterales bacterium]|nr:acyl-CoA dehydrogenase family protein [Ktedonobacterales bacterium]